MKTKLYTVRKSEGLTLQQMAAFVGVDAGNLSRLERGMQGASLSLAEKISKLFHGKISEIEILYPERYLTNSVIDRSL